MASAAPEIPVLARDEAFESLYRRYVKDVYHYALALLRNPADAEDVTQTTFLNAYRAFRRGERIEKPQNWLIKIAHNVARSRYARSTRRVKEVPLEDHVEQLAAPEEERPNIEGVLRALGRLPFNQRAALVMRELEGKSYAEIADTLGVSVAAVETLIFRARRSLRMRAAAIRSLGAVPLPASLAQIVEGGGVVAGGGALFGGGFVVKAAVALIAGAIATSVGGGGQDTVADAARTPKAAAAALHASQSPSRHVSRIQRAHAALQARVQKVLRGHQARSRSANGATVFGASASAGRSARAAATEASSAPSGPSAAQTEATAPASTPVDTAAGTVQSTVSTVTSALPVQTPPLPAPAVQPPPAPSLP